MFLIIVLNPFYLVVTAIQGIIDAANEHILEHNSKEKQELKQLEDTENLTKVSKFRLQLCVCK